MEPRELLNAVEVASRLKDTTRHNWTAKGRKESVAEHCWMMTLISFFIKDGIKKEFPEADMDKVTRMCMIHDLGEAFIGDIPSFIKTDADEAEEEAQLFHWVQSLPQAQSEEMLALYDEMIKLETVEAKIYKAIDGLEAVIQHNASDLSFWIPLEYELNMTNADDKVAFSDYLKALREEMRRDTAKKIGLDKE